MTALTVDQSSQQHWFKSSYSAGVGTDCIEVAQTSEFIRVRDSKDPGGAVLAFPSGAWDAFVQEVRLPDGVFGQE